MDTVKTCRISAENVLRTGIRTERLGDACPQLARFLILENRKRLAGVCTGDTQGYIKAC